MQSISKLSLNNIVNLMQMEIYQLHKYDFWSVKMLRLIECIIGKMIFVDTMSHTYIGTWIYFILT
jgi:hypothetical protein